MNILIIGNGFDLAHGLDTKYTDFLQHCRRLPQESKIHTNLWLRYFFDLTEKNNSFNNTWIDFETEIYNQIRNLRQITQHTYHIYADNKNPHCTNPNINAYFKENNYHYGGTLDKALRTNKEKIAFVYNQLRDFTKAFEKYLTDHINTSPVTSSYKFYSSEILDGRQCDIKWGVISFNYTDTFNRLYQDAANTHFVYVHGKADADADECNLVFGTQSFDRIEKKEEDKTGKDKDLPHELNVFQKHNQRHKYGTIDAYQDLLRELKKQDTVALL